MVLAVSMYNLPMCLFITVGRYCTGVQKPHMKEWLLTDFN